DQETHGQPVPIPSTVRVLACLFHQVPVDVFQAPLVGPDVPTPPNDCCNVPGTNQVMSNGTAS
ncbi:MAG: hypothetical protein OET44_21475, partial [Gammaproteobacteria bacterium]|nr:hypothetical protein [Gammaproteobacteria bacterium]